MEAEDPIMYQGSAMAFDSGAIFTFHFIHHCFAFKFKLYIHSFIFQIQRTLLPLNGRDTSRGGAQGGTWDRAWGGAQGAPEVELEAEPKEDSKEEGFLDDNLPDGMYIYICIYLVSRTYTTNSDPGLFGRPFCIGDAEFGYAHIAALFITDGH